MTDAICYLNGEYQPLSETKISVLDRGFIFGDGVYEVVPVYQEKLFRFDHHIARLTRSLEKIGMPNPLSREQWLELCRTLVRQYREKYGDLDQVVYIQVTRGVAKRDHAFPKNTPQTIFAMTNPLPKVSDAIRHSGCHCISTTDFRWQKGDIKSTSLLGACLARQMSVEADALETIMFRNGILTEASASNVWIVKDSHLYAPIKDADKLEGIRYGLLEEICKQKNIPLHFENISEVRVRNADEILVTSATKEIVACTKLDGHIVGNGKPGPMYQTLLAGYQDKKAMECI
jgi:D-alanine transaminase